MVLAKCQRKISYLRHILVPNEINILPYCKTTPKLKMEFVAICRYTKNRVRTTFRVISLTLQVTNSVLGFFTHKNNLFVR